jgi:hypothetical protein
MSTGSGPGQGGGYTGFQSGMGLGSMLGGLFGNSKWKNPADAGMGYLNQIPGAMSPYLDPYASAGRNALGPLQQQYMQLMNNPGGMMNQMGAGFQQSPGYQFNVNQATNAANRAAQAGGMVGSPQEQQSLASNVSGLANQDYYNYLNKAMGLYGQGLQGEQGMANMGLQAGTTMANNLAQALMSQSNMAYAGQQNDNQHQGGFWSSLGGMLGGGASMIPGVGSFMKDLF